MSRIGPSSPSLPRAANLADDTSVVMDGLSLVLLSTAGTLLLMTVLQLLGLAAPEPMEFVVPVILT